jgi:drug/metabolite transporter (DMT)-like permease
MNTKNKILYWIPKILVILLGAFLIVFGGYDDSPGAQLLGLVLIIITVIFVIRGRKKKQ